MGIFDKSKDKTKDGADKTVEVGKEVGKKGWDIGKKVGGAVIDIGKKGVDKIDKDVVHKNDKKEEEKEE